MFAPLFPFRTLALVICCAASVDVAAGYVKEGTTWPNNSNALMQLELGPTGVTLEDGSATWDASAADALSLWNPYMDAFQFSWLAGSTASEASGDGLNSVFFSNSVFGDDFGDGVLAITVLLFDTSNGSISREGDVVVNQAYQYNSYRGPLKPGDPATRIYDIHRIFLHEFGHVLGLDHPDDFNQKVVAIMNSVISDLDSLATDDTSGAYALYGLRVTSPTQLTSFIDNSIRFQVTTNAIVDSYSETGLPPGLSINSATGLITGKVTVTGGWDAQVTVTGKRSVTSTLSADVTWPSGNGDLRQTFAFTANRMLSDPVRERVYASMNGSNSIAVIDAVTLTLITTIPVSSEPSGMTLSLDGKTLFVAEKGTGSPAIGVIDLDQLVSEPNLPAPFPSYDIAAGSEGRLFLSSWGYFSTVLAQVDSTTGEVLSPFPSSVPFGRLQISPDLKTLYVGATGFSPATVYAVDVSSDSPVVVSQTPFQRVGGLFDFKLSHDGTFLCVPGYASGTVLHIPSDDLTATGDEYVLGHGGAFFGFDALALSPDDSLTFIARLTLPTSVFGVDVFDAGAQYVRTIFTDNFAPEDGVVDGSGKYLFLSSFETPLLKVYSTEQTIVPYHQPSPKSLLNISTRLNAQPGDDALIAGFIISGNEPKTVVIRALGPSLPLDGVLTDPTLVLYDGTGKVLASNDNWTSNADAVLGTGIAPIHSEESVIVTTLNPGHYTAVVRGVGDSSGIALVEVYDLTADVNSTLANISTRGKVETDSNVMIGGFIISQDQLTTVLIRAIGPSLAANGITDPLQDPVLDLYDGYGTLLVENDDWRSTQAADIIATGIAPTDDRESAMSWPLYPGNYTAIVRSKDNTTGIALVEVYNLDSTASSSK